MVDKERKEKEKDREGGGDGDLGGERRAGHDGDETHMELIAGARGSG